MLPADKHLNIGMKFKFFKNLLVLIVILFEFSEFLHWLVVNIPNNDIGSGETISEYIGSGPPKCIF